jgi:hypothetical protein
MDPLMKAAAPFAVIPIALSMAMRQGLTFDEHFSFDGTLLEAWASAKSFQPRKASPDRPRTIRAIRP